MKENFDIIWKSVKDNYGKEFFKVREGLFSYTIGDDDSFNPFVPAY